MITARQKREPVVAAVEVCSAFVRGLIDLREFAALYPEMIDSATKLFSDYERDFKSALAAASSNVPILKPRGFVSRRSVRILMNNRAPRCIYCG